MQRLLFMLLLVTVPAAANARRVAPATHVVRPKPVEGVRHPGLERLLKRFLADTGERGARLLALRDRSR
jgi:hypothetical protein